MVAAMDATRRQFFHVAAGAAGWAAGPLHVLAQSGPRSAMGERLMAFLDHVDRQDLSFDPQAAVLRGELARASEFGDYLSDEHFRGAEALLRAQLLTPA